MSDLKFNINTNEYLPLRDVVFNTLRDSILSGKLLPGERLMENQLAEKLGVSRTPIREALRMLELENLVELVPRKGAQVLDMSEKDIRDVLEVRCSMEVLAMELACERIGREQIKKLREIEQRLIDLGEAGDLEKIADLDEEFHDMIFFSTGNDKLIQIMNNLRTQLYRYRIAFLKSESIDVIIMQHKEIIRTLENGLKDEGSKAAAVHIKHQAEVILKSLKLQTAAQK